MGTVNGSATVAFYSSSDAPRASYVPHTRNDGGTYQTGAYSTTDWVELFFPGGTLFGSPLLNPWSWTYVTTDRSPVQTWVDASSGESGNITG